MKLRPRGLTEAQVFAWFMPGPPPPAHLCWNWTRSCSGPSGSGQFGYTTDGHSKNVAAHHAAYRIYHGPIPEGLHVLHTCKNRRCCQPAHLKAGIRTRKPRIPTVRATAQERFWRRVDRNGPINPTFGNRCWIWQPANTHWDGRPVKLDELSLTVDGKTVSATKFSYELAGNKTKPDRPLTHRCKYRLCVNPLHLGYPEIQPPRPPSPTGHANHIRQQQAATHRIASAKAAIPIIRRMPAEQINRHNPEYTKTRYLTVLEARIKQPDATLAELGARLGMTKDSYSAALRRATELVETPRKHWTHR